MTRWFSAALIAVAILATVPSCGSDPDESVTPQPSATAITSAVVPPTVVPPTPVPTTEPLTSPTAVPPTAAPVIDAVSVESLFDGEGARDASVRGLLYVDDAGTRLCDALMESYPPQCGWAWVVVANPGDLDVELDEAQGIAWSPSPVVLTGTYDGTRFVLDDGPDPSPTVADEAMVAAFVAFAGGGAVDDVPLAATVSLGLADEIVRSVPAGDLGSPAAWAIERMEFRGWSGPFSAVDLADTDIGITVGPHAHCASPPVAAPPGFEDHRRVSIQPTDATSCLEWFTVDFFVDDAGAIAAVTVDLFAP